MFCLHATFVEWIDLGGTWIWPPRSPDITLRDLSIWGIIKNNAFSKPFKVVNNDDFSHI